MRALACSRRACVPSGNPPSESPYPNAVGVNVRTPLDSVYAWVASEVGDQLFAMLNASKFSESLTLSFGMGMILVRRTFSVCCHGVYRLSTGRNGTRKFPLNPFNSEALYN